MLAWRVYWLYTRYHTRVDPSDSTRIFTFRRRPQIRGCAKAQRLHRAKQDLLRMRRDLEVRRASEERRDVRAWRAATGRRRVSR